MKGYCQPIGRVTVAYIPDQPCPGTIRVVLTETGECLKQEHVDSMTDEQWEEVVQRYKRMLCEK